MSWLWCGQREDTENRAQFFSVMRRGIFMFPGELWEEGRMRVGEQPARRSASKPPPSPQPPGHQSEKFAEQLLRAVILNIQFDMML